MTERLDAYGHLNFTVGNEDWIACFDAIRTPEGIEYEVVVNCESGGFIDTVEHRTVPATLEGIRSLLGLPDCFASICMEHYADDTEEEYGPVEWKDTLESWDRHLRDLVSASAPDAGEGEGEGWWDEATIRSWRP